MLMFSSLSFNSKIYEFDRIQFINWISIQMLKKRPEDLHSHALESVHTCKEAIRVLFRRDNGPTMQGLRISYDKKKNKNKKKT